MGRIFLISDTHFGHEKCWSVFKNAEGLPMRPFKSTEEMDETMVANWNKAVTKRDTVWHLGDVSISKTKLPILQRLNGIKKLVLGNHDIHGIDEYRKYFSEVVPLFQYKKKAIFTHIPLHPDSINRWGINIHGHLHHRVVLASNNLPDPRYVNVSVEQINYTPKAIEEILPNL